MYEEMISAQIQIIVATLDSLIMLCNNNKYKKEVPSLKMKDVELRCG